MQVANSWKKVLHTFHWNLKRVYACRNSWRTLQKENRDKLENKWENNQNVRFYFMILMKLSKTSRNTLTECQLPVMNFVFWFYIRRDGALHTKYDHDHHWRKIVLRHVLWALWISWFWHFLILHWTEFVCVLGWTVFFIFKRKYWLWILNLSPKKC